MMCPPDSASVWMRGFGKIGSDAPNGGYGSERKQGMLFDIKPDVRIKIEGMHCPKCVARVKEALEAVDGVVKAEVSLEEGSAVVSGNADVQALVTAVEGIGFDASA